MCLQKLITNQILWYLFETAILIKSKKKKIDSKLIKYWSLKLKEKYLEARNILKNKRKMKKSWKIRKTNWGVSLFIWIVKHYKYIRFFSKDIGLFTHTTLEVGLSFKKKC